MVKTWKHHKLITIDTPHLGSPLATQLLNGQNGCVANAFAEAELPVFRSVQLSNNGASLSVPAAVGDLVDSPLSQALQNIAAPGRRTLPTAYIAGTVNLSNLPLLTGNGAAFGLYTACGIVARDPLALGLADWPSVFNGQASDAIVSLSSELGGLANPDPNSVFDGNIHSSGLLKLGFHGPSVLDSGSVPAQVINLLNTPITNSMFHPTNP